MAIEASINIFSEIEAGIWDDGLEALSEAVRARRIYVREQLKIKNQLEMRHGDRVRIININPKYLIGVTGSINKNRMPNRHGDIMVDIDPLCMRRLRGRFSSTLSIPASSLERL